jgi:hypothetical protein
MKKLFVFSVITGEVYPIEQEDVKTLFKYQIPLTDKPRSSCNRCYGRGYAGVDPTTKFYQICSCMSRKISPDCDITNIVVEMPRVA